MPKVTKAKTVLQEVLASGITQAHVRKRVKDWQRRIGDLYARLEDWLPEGWEVATTSRIRMYEPMMKAHKVRGIYLPCLELRGTRRQKVDVIPDSLWIVGCNGRIDFKTGTEHYVILDMADIFEKPNWRITLMYSRKHEYVLNSKSFKAILENAGTRPHSRRLSGNQRSV